MLFRIDRLHASNLIEIIIKYDILIYSRTNNFHFSLMICTGRLLLQAIKVDPRDDTPRLVYADWLDEQGDAKQAELIRLGCRLARLEPNTPKAETKYVRAEFERLAAECGRRLELSVVGYFQHVERLGEMVKPGITITYDRGLPVVGFPADATPYSLLPLLNEHPEIVGIDIGRPVGPRPLLTSVRHLLQSEELGRLGIVRLCNQSLPPDTAVAFARNPALSNLSQLSIEHCNFLTDDVAQALAGNPALHNLSELKLSAMGGGDIPQCPLSTDAIVTLSSGTYAAGLDSLNISDCGLRRDDLRQLCEAPVPLPGLRRLEIWQNNLWNGDLNLLARSRRFHPDAVVDIQPSPYWSQFGIVRTGSLTELRRLIHTPDFQRDLRQQRVWGR